MTLIPACWIRSTISMISFWLQIYQPPVAHVLATDSMRAQAPRTPRLAQLLRMLRLERVSTRAQAHMLSS